MQRSEEERLVYIPNDERIVLIQPPHRSQISAVSSIGANEKGNLAGQLVEPFRDSALQRSNVFAGVFHVLVFLFPTLR